MRLETEAALQMRSARRLGYDLTLTLTLTLIVGVRSPGYGRSDPRDSSAIIATIVTANVANVAIEIRSGRLRKMVRWVGPVRIAGP